MHRPIVTRHRAPSLRRSIAFAAALTALSASCATVPVAPPGRLMMKIDERVSHVRLRAQELHVGDVVRFSRTSCTTQSKGPAICKLQSVGDGVVAQLLNITDAVVQVDPGVIVQEGDVVEKIRP